MKKITFLFIALSFAMFSMAEVTGTFSGSIPAGWTYITNNPEYPDPSFYGTPAGLKLNFEGQGFESPALAPENEATVTLTIGALNQNTKTAASTDVFTVTAYNAASEVVDTKKMTSVQVGANSVTLNGTAIVKVKVIMTGYPSDGTKWCNINLTSCSVAGSATAIKNVTIDNSVYATNGTVYAEGEFQIFSVAGQNVTELNGQLNGIYVVKTANGIQKVAVK